MKTSRPCGSANGTESRVVAGGDLAGRRKSEMVEEIAQNLSEQADTTISLLHSREREALSALLARGGWMPNGEFAERYGTDEDDKWVWNGTLPFTILGWLRHFLLAAVGVHPAVGRVILVPADLRTTFKSVLRERF